LPVLTVAIVKEEDMAQIVETSQYLTFTLDEEQYAVDVAKVREVLEYTKVTRVPRMPEYMCGVINLRGSVVPVIDLRLKFGLKAVERTINTSIVVMEIEMGEDTVVLGALTDSVKEVIDFEAGDIEPAPRIGTKLETEFIRGMGKKNDSFIIILDIDRVFSAEELIRVKGMELEGKGEN